MSRDPEPHDAYPSLPMEPLRGADGVWLQDSAANPMIINGLYTLDPIDLDFLRRLWHDRVIAAGEGERYPRFTRRVVKPEGRHHWQTDPEFSIERHVVHAPDVDREWSRGELRRYLGDLAPRSLPPDRPLWQLQLVPRFEGGRSVVIVRIHHCMGDGIALIPVLFSIQDQPPAEHPAAKPGDDPALRVAKAKPSRATLALKAPLAGPFVLLKKLLERPDRSVVHGPEPTGDKRVAWSEPLDLERIKAVKDALGATVNDVLMSCVTGAFRRYVEARQGSLLPQLRASVPVNVRSAGEPLRMENKFAAVPFNLPAHLADPRERIAEVRRRMARMKTSLVPLVVYGSVTVMLKVLPAGASRKLIDFFANKCTCVLTNVPGPSRPITMGGRRLHDLMFWVPQRSRIGIGVSILSFSGTVRMGVIGDAAVLPDPEALIDAFAEELTALEAAAGLTADQPPAVTATA